LQTITVVKADLLNKLNENLATHEESVEKARKGYNKRVKELTDELSKRAAAGKNVAVQALAIYNLPVPKNHRMDYERVIQMVEWHQSDTFELSEHEVAQYIMDYWQWKREFATTNASYGTASAAELEYLQEE
jgi:hypothetical protein